MPLYEVDSQLEPVCSQLETLPSESTKALLIVHYFGQPQPIELCQAYCERHSLALIEDNAHGFGASLEGRLLRTFGTVGFSSPRKSFPIRNGAYLCLSGCGSLEMPELAPEPFVQSILKRRIKQRLKTIPFFQRIAVRKRRMSEYRRRLGDRPRYESQQAFRELRLDHDFAMDRSSELVIQQQDIQATREKRHAIYELWEDWAEANGLKPAFSVLSPGAMPLVFPAFTASARDSVAWFEWGHRAGIDIHSWPTLPQAIADKSEATMRLWETLVCFPIHQAMDIELLESRLAELGEFQ